MPLNLSTRSAMVAQSEIRSMTIECNRRGGVNLAQGICDLPVPDVVRAGAKRAMDDGFNIYTRYDGLPELRRAVAAKYEREYGFGVDPDAEVTVTAGATGAFHCVCAALLNPGDEVIVFAPHYGYHLTSIRAAGCVPVSVPLAGGGWEFCDADLEKAVTSRTRAVVVNTPGNPTGKVFYRDEIARIGRIAEAHDLFIFTDEIYEHFVYDGNEHVLPASVGDLRRRTITISGCSKVFSVTGWRIGYVVCDAAYATAIGHFNDLYYVCAPAPLQLGAAAGLDGLDDAFYRDLCDGYRQKRDMLCGALDAAGITPVVPQGAYYVLADMGAVPGKDGREKALRLLADTGVAAVPGRAFFADGTGERFARFCFARTGDVVDGACRRLRAYAG